MKTALITGITGMVGSHLADFLYENTNWNIIGLTRWRSPLENIKNLIDPINNKCRVKLIYGDLNDDNSLDLAIKTAMPDYVFHLAAQSFPLTSFTSPVDTLNTNVLGTARLLEAIKKNKPDCIVHVCASSEVFGRVSKDKLPIDEECLFHPASPYAISKTGTDLLGRFYAEAYKMNIMTTRMFTHTGPRRGDVFAESSFAKQIALIEAGYIDPVVKVGNLKSLILHTLINMSTAKDKIKIEVDPDRIRPIDADLQVPNTNKFTLHTGWQPEISFEQTMRDLLDYWREQVMTHKGKFLVR
jgi:GDPmannose 4,6-dehydratase